MVIPSACDVSAAAVEHQEVALSYITLFFIIKQQLNIHQNFKIIAEHKFQSRIKHRDDLNSRAVLRAPKCYKKVRMQYIQHYITVKNIRNQKTHLYNYIYKVYTAALSSYSLRSSCLPRPSARFVVVLKTKFYCNGISFLSTHIHSYINTPFLKLQSRLRINMHATPVTL